MVDEFQDTNRLQLDLLEALERDNLFAVGDEFQSIYRFRHADVSIFRERRARLGDERVRGLAANFRSGEELLDVLNAAFAPELGAGVPPAAGRPAPRARGRRAAAVRPRSPGGRAARGAAGHRHAGVGRPRGAARPGRARRPAVAPRRGAAASPTGCGRRSTPGRRPGDIVVLVRATASLRLFEQALEEQGLPTYVVGGRGYWSQEQVRDALAYLAALANPRDERRALRRARLPVLRRRQRRAGAARRGRARRRPRAVGRAARGRDGSGRPDRPTGPADRRPDRPTGPADSAGPPVTGRRPRVARRPHRGRPRPARGLRPLLRRRARAAERLPVEALLERAIATARATTSRSWPGPAASGGWRTCAS